MVAINMETFLVCLVKNKLSESVRDGNELGDNVLFTQEDIILFKSELRKERGIDCSYSVDDIMEIVLQYTELFVTYDTPTSSMCGLRWDEIFLGLDGQSLIEYLLTSLGVMYFPPEVKKFLGLEKVTDSFDISKVPSNAIEEIINLYEKCKSDCLSMKGKSDNEIVIKLMNFYNETIISMALKYIRSENNGDIK